MNTEGCVDLEFMELEEQERLTDHDAFMLGVVREPDDERSTVEFGL